MILQWHNGTALIIIVAKQINVFEIIQIWRGQIEEEDCNKLFIKEFTNNIYYYILIYYIKINPMRNSLHL